MQNGIKSAEEDSSAFLIDGKLSFGVLGKLVIGEEQVKLLDRDDLRELQTEEPASDVKELSNEM